MQIQLNWPTKNAHALYLAGEKGRRNAVQMSPDIKEAKAQVHGSLLKRRDTSDYFKDTYGMVIKKLSREGMESVLVQLQARMKSDFREVPLEKLISKALRESYKNPQTIAHK
jgi:hypothetical protein